MYETILEEVEDYRNRDWDDYENKSDYDDGYADGHQEGFDEGYKAGLEAVMVHGEDDEIV